MMSQKPKVEDVVVGIDLVCVVVAVVDHGVVGVVVADQEVEDRFESAGNFERYEEAPQMSVKAILQKVKIVSNAGRMIKLLTSLCL